MIAPAPGPWCNCVDVAKPPIPMPLRGRAVLVASDRGECAEMLRGVCVRCRRVVLTNGQLGTFRAVEQMQLHALCLPVTYARRVIENGGPVDPDLLPSVEQINDICGLMPIRMNTFPFSTTDSDDIIRAQMRALFGVPDGAPAKRITAPGVRRPIIVGEHFFEHPFEQQRRRDDPGHIKGAFIAPNTVYDPIEVWMDRRGSSRSYKFLGIYDDLDGARRPDYLYHAVYALGTGELKSTFVLTGGANAFRQSRTGKLLYAAYARTDFV